MTKHERAAMRLHDQRHEPCTNVIAASVLTEATSAISHHPIMSYLVVASKVSARKYCFGSSIKHTSQQPPVCFTTKVPPIRLPVCLPFKWKKCSPVTLIAHNVLLLHSPIKHPPAMIVTMLQNGAVTAVSRPCSGNLTLSKP